MKRMEQELPTDPNFVETSKAIQTPKVLDAQKSMETSKSSESPKRLERPKSMETPKAPRDLQDEVRQRAYEIYLQRGEAGGSGSDVEDWLQAEAELLHGHRRDEAA